MIIFHHGSTLHHNKLQALTRFIQPNRLFVCLVFNNTNSAKSLYRTTIVCNVSRWAGSISSQSMVSTDYLTRTTKRRNT